MESKTTREGVLRTTTLYVADNGRTFCGRLRCAGTWAFHTGCDANSNRKLLKLTPRLFRKCQRDGTTPKCETCGFTYTPSVGEQRAELNAAASKCNPTMERGELSEDMVSTLADDSTTCDTPIVVACLSKSSQHRDVVLVARARDVWMLTHGLKLGGVVVGEIRYRLASDDLNAEQLMERGA